MSSTFRKPINTFARDLMVDGLSQHWDVNIAVTLDDNGIAPDWEPLLPYVSSISIPCGVHAGHPVAIQAAVATAKQHQCSVGAAIGLPPNHENLSDSEWAAWVLVQIGALRTIAQAAGVELHYVRPAQPLYDEYFAASQPRLLTLANTMAQLDNWLMLVGPFGPALEDLAKEASVRTVGEIHIGKRYKDGGQPLLNDSSRFLHGKAMVDQIHQLLKEGTLTSQTGKTVSPRELSTNVATLHVDNNLKHVEQTLKNLTQRLQKPVPLPVAVAAPSGWV